MLIFHRFFGVLVKIIWILTGERVRTLSGDPGEVSAVHLLIPVVEVILDVISRLIYYGVKTLF